MMDIIFFQFKHSFIKKKNIKFFIGILFILFIFLFKIKHYFRDYDLNGGLKDYMIFSVGGWENPVLFTSLLEWSFFVFLILCMSINITNDFEKLYIITLNRIGSKLKSWIYICINELFFCILITILVYVSGLLIGGSFLGYNPNSTGYTRLFYKNLCDVNFGILLISEFINFFTGIYLLQIIIRGFSSIFHKINTFYVFVLIVCMFSGFLFIYSNIPKILCPIFYPSLFSLNLTSLYFNIFMNIVLTILFIILGYFLYLKIDIN